ncbi:ATP-dependent RNA helicase DbpA [Alteromonadaceae bacterium BrNp21-10]|nr:ATP-dependent RNA helicase DbpA [Alteromonadaceae bacterium BrNp21-10]
MSNAFSSLNLIPALEQNLESLGFTQMTEIQAQSLPVILQGQDVIAQAKTGSGKTVAFGIGLLARLQVNKFRIQTLVMCPTRELAEQVAEEIRRIARLIHNIKVLTLCGGTPMGPQIQSLEHGAHIIVGTPGRIMDHLQRRRLNLKHVNTLVLDEADRMLDMGFEDEIDAVIANVPNNRQTLLFSATYPEAIDKMSHSIQRNPQRINVESTHTSAKIEQIFYEVEDSKRDNGVCRLLSHYQPNSAIIFCNTKKETQELADYLATEQFSVLALHGDMEQRERNQVLYRFSNQSVCILVATDVAARGLDIKDVEVVISYNITPDPEVHVHRIGRTGRAGATGFALTLCSPKEVARANAIEDYLGQKISWKNVIGHIFHRNRILGPQYTTLCIDGGKKHKLRPGDILGALTKDAGIVGDDIGKINITSFHAYVAIKARSVKAVMNHLRTGKIKGKTFKVRKF